MKKIIFLMISLLLLVSCSKKTPITAEDFSAKMTEAGFEIGEDEVEGADLVMIAHNGNYQLEHYTFKDKAAAETAFNNVKAGIETNKTTGYVETSVALGSHAKYQLTSGELYFVASYIDNTLIYASSSKADTDKVKELFDTLGY